VDRSGRNNHGTLTNMGGQNNWQVSGSGVALAFDNTNDRVQTNLGLPLNDFTACGWFVDYGTKNGTFRRVIDKNYVNGFWIGLNGIGGAGTYGGGIRQTTGQLGIFLDLPSTASRWSFIAMTRRGTTQTLYLANGTALATTLQTVSSTATSGTADLLQIGNTLSGIGDTWNGLLDDLRVYNRALTPQEIRLLASGRGIGLTAGRQRRTSASSRRLYQNVSGTWKESLPLVNVGGVWKEGAVYENVDGTWKN
jgi:hypothetical protein